MASKPWENRLMEETAPEMTPFSRKSEGLSYSSSGQGSVEVRRNNITSKVSARPVAQNPPTRSSSSPSFASLYEETSSPSTSSASPSPTLVFSSSFKVGNSEEMIGTHKPSYMNLTASTKAKQRFLMEEFPCFSSPMAMPLSSADSRSCAGYNLSVNWSRDLYPPVSTSRCDGARSRRPRV